MDAREKEFVRIYNEYFAKVHSVVNKILHDEDASDDCVQDVFIHVWQHLEQYTKAKTLGAYLVKSAQHKAYEVLHRREKMAQYENEAALRIAEDVDSKSISIGNEAATMGILDKALARVKCSPAGKEAFKLVRYHGLSHKEASERLHVAVRWSFNAVHIVSKQVLEVVRKDKTLNPYNL
jgi:RNA polymerase sigma-70 factor (ECF subfamily)